MEMRSGEVGSTQNFLVIPFRQIEDDPSPGKLAESGRKPSRRQRLYSAGVDADVIGEVQARGAVFFLIVRRRELQRQAGALTVRLDRVQRVDAELAERVDRRLQSMLAEQIMPSGGHDRERRIGSNNIRSVIPREVERFTAYDLAKQRALGEQPWLHLVEQGAIGVGRKRHAGRRIPMERVVRVSND